MDIVPIFTEFIKNTFDDNNDINHGKLVTLFASIDVKIKQFNNPDNETHIVYSAIYNDNTDFKKHPITRLSRGIFFSIIDKTFVPVARPFDKFFNFNEHKERFPDEFVEILDRHDGKITTFEKLDGQIIKLFYHHDRFYFGTNTVAFEQPDNIAKFFANNHIDIDEFFGKLYPDYTYIFELTAPLTHVTFYSEIALTLIGIRHTYSGLEIDIRKYGKKFNHVPVAQYTEFNSFEEIFADVNDVKKSSADPSFEGRIACLPNKLGTFYRFKIKGVPYFNRYVLSRSKITYAGLIDMLGGPTNVAGATVAKDLSDYKEAVSYIPDIHDHVNRTYQLILADIDALLTNLPKIKTLPKNERFRHIAKFRLGRYIGMSLLNKKTKITHRVAIDELMSNKKREKIIKKLLAE